MTREGTGQRLQRVALVAWPGFLAALVAEFAFFAMFDPLDFNERLALSREAVYTLGFVAFWMLGSLSSALTLLLSKAASERLA